jgi:hypothetical protein
MACCEPTERWLRTELRTTLVLRSSPVGPGFSAALAAHGRRDRASQTLSALFAARASPTEQPGLSLGLGAFVQPPNFPWPWTQNFARRGSSLDGGGAEVKSGCRSEKCGKGCQFDSRSSFCRFGRLSAVCRSGSAGGLGAAGAVVGCVLPGARARAARPEASGGALVAFAPLRAEGASRCCGR